MIRKKRFIDYAFDSFNYVFLTVLAITCLYPLVFVLFASVSEPTQLIQQQGVLLRPLGFTLEGYKLAFKNPNILIGYGNTLLYVIVGTSASVFFTALAGYVFSRKRLKYTKFFMYGIVFTMFFNGGLIPFFLLMKNIGLYDKRLLMILNGMIWTWNLIIMKTSFGQIPDSLEESARVDGANDWTILFKIILPLSKPVVAVMVLFYSVGRWNEWFMSMILLKDRAKFPLQLILREILIVNDKNTMLAGANLSAESTDMYRQLLQYSTIIIATLPILFIYPFIQKHFVKGVMIGSIKG
ncbi:carbohydrate ABC transporter permease [Vallitalea pronyensis]|uniref:Carbohydrate ABC transporter permease n=1 Tax=Vallitalea pronyensis TaxID=1348613 RepID=A0A8J8MM46_9FIRM|nr:carbohydrate ABC transporter permease [Vallitalea pronyensis]QUI24046.1 carbohydrate ABC transporter permease [Vallitalea pronyensis]